jgi:hypothetical protein
VEVPSALATALPSLATALPSTFVPAFALGSTLSASFFLLFSFFPPLPFFPLLPFFPPLPFLLATLFGGMVNRFMLSWAI